MEKLDSILLPCTDEKCTSTFKNQKALLNHVNDYHKLEYVVNFKKNKDALCVKLKRNKNRLLCPYCTNNFNSFSAIRKHLTRLEGNCETNKDSPNSDLDDENDAVHVLLPDCPSYDDSLPVPSDPCRRHSFAEAIVQGCQSMEASEDEKSKNEWIIGKLQLEPMALIEDSESIQKAEYNAFTHAVNIQRMTGKRFICHPIVPAKRKLQKSSSHEILATSFAHLIHSSPLRDILLERHYFEVNHEVCQMLNADWEHAPHIKYACAQVLAGCILVNEKAGQAVLVNTLEVYCRLRSVDIHRELSNQHGSLPPPTSYYENVCPCVLTTSDGEKLTIGTQTMNALITSTIRLDIKEEPKVGPTTCTADFRSKTIKIYIDHGSWEKAVKISKNTITRQLEQFNLTSQLRQIRSQFHHPSSYYLIRASSFLAMPFSCQPLSVFTFENHEHGNNKTNAHEKASMIASRLFKLIAHQVLSTTKPSLSKAQVNQLASQCATGKVRDILVNISSSLTDADDILILHNRELNNSLTQLASLMSSDIAKVNKSYVIPNIQKRLKALLEE
ncbi:hypothetical protein INT45_008476 [Circinella minor]|uniref:C2H2-type domain-containing protein n=1 Tax=Circinella minor TaxID=1195481 RepID=A0A8H7SFL0_9FUNG|nr:hypothetical protein INT45_008476 [Circinella minor]